MKTESDVVKEAWRALEAAIIYYQGRPVGTIAACDPTADALNYDQCFVRDFVASALVFLIDGKPEIVRNFLIEVLALQSSRKQMDCFQPGKGLMPASFKVVSKGESQSVIADFGEQAIGRVTPVDSSLWWIILLRAYVKATGDFALVHQAEFQHGIRLILDLCLVARFDMYPTISVPDGSFMIDRRMGVYGRPLEIQALFYATLRAARELLLSDREGTPYLQAVNDRLGHLTYHIREYYWLDPNRLHVISLYKGEEFGEAAVNRFNIYPDSIPHWLTDWLPPTGGYLTGNLGAGWMDFRFFTLGNLMAIVTTLAHYQHSQAILSLIEQRWQDLIGNMPMKICFPALEDQEWKTITGCDPKNTPWSYHNGGNWPVLIWPLAAAAQKIGRVELAHRAIEIAQKRLASEQWPEYYDGRDGSLIGKQARKYQTWTIAGFLLAQELVKKPENLALISFDEEMEVVACSI